MAEELKGVPEELLETATAARRRQRPRRRAAEQLEPRPSRTCSTPRPRRRTCAAGWKRTSPTPAPMPRPALPATSSRSPTTFAGAAIRSRPKCARTSKLKSFIAGIEATAARDRQGLRRHGITRIAAMGLPLDPNQHQAMLEVPLGRGRAGHGRAGTAGRLHDQGPPAAPGDGGGGEEAGLRLASVRARRSRVARLRTAAADRIQILRLRAAGRRDTCRPARLRVDRTVAAEWPSSSHATSAAVDDVRQQREAGVTIWSASLSRCERLLSAQPAARAETAELHQGVRP